MPRSEYEKVIKLAERKFGIHPFYTWIEGRDKREFTILHSGGYNYFGEEPKMVAVIETERITCDADPKYRIKGIFLGKAPGKDMSKKEHDKALTGPELVRRILEIGERINGLDDLKQCLKVETKKAVQNVG